MSQHINSHGHLPPCFLSLLHSNPHLCVSFWSPWYWGILWPHSWLEVLVILLVNKKWCMSGLESSAILIFLFIVVWLELKKNWISLSETQSLSTSSPPRAPWFAPISCHMFFPIFHNTFSHSTSKTLLCVLCGLGVICWSYFCLCILLSVVWLGLWEKRATSWFELIDLHETGIMVLSTVVPTPFVSGDSLDKTRFRFYCIDIYHFKICLHYPPSPPVITHFLLSPSTISHLHLLLIFSSMREIPHQSPLLPLPTSVHHLTFLSCLLPQTLHLTLACLC